MDWEDGLVPGQNLLTAMGEPSVLVLVALRPVVRWFLPASVFQTTISEISVIHTAVIRTNSTTSTASRTDNPQHTDLLLAMLPLRPGQETGTEPDQNDPWNRAPMDTGPREPAAFLSQSGQSCQRRNQTMAPETDSAGEQVEEQLELDV